MSRSAIKPIQVKKIHALKSALKLSDEVYRDVLFTCFRVESSKQLNTLQADRLIGDLEEKAVAAGVWESRRRDQRFKVLQGRGGMATPPQLRMIESIWHQVSRAPDPESRSKALRSLLERVAKVSDLRFLDQEGAGKMINALKAMQARQEPSKKKYAARPF